MPEISSYGWMSFWGQVKEFSNRESALDAASHEFGPKAAQGRSH